MLRDVRVLDFVGQPRCRGELLASFVDLNDVHGHSLHPLEVGDLGGVLEVGHGEVIPTRG